MGVIFWTIVIVGISAAAIFWTFNFGYNMGSTHMMDYFLGRLQREADEAIARLKENEPE